MLRVLGQSFNQSAQIFFTRVFSGCYAILTSPKKGETAVCGYIPLCFEFFWCRVDVLESLFSRSTISIAVFCLQNLICLLVIFADKVFIDPTFFGILLCGPLHPSFVVNVFTLCILGP